MKTFIGKETVQAEPMNELQAVQLGYARPNEDHHEWREGFHILHPDGYHSWSPKYTFMCAYQCAETFRDRLFIELDEVQQRQDKLKEYLHSKPFNELPAKIQELLEGQFGAMTSYISYLERRIDIIIMSAEELDTEHHCSCNNK